MSRRLGANVKIDVRQINMCILTLLKNGLRKEAVRSPYMNKFSLLNRIPLKMACHEKLKQKM